jgi:hypothetical protein
MIRSTDVGSENGRILTSGSVRHLAIALIPAVRSPSIPASVMNSCMLGVNRNGTCSLGTSIGCAAPMADKLVRFELVDHQESAYMV